MLFFVTLCCFCKHELETINHLLCNSPEPRDGTFCLGLNFNILKLVYYSIILGKTYLWSKRRSEVLLNISSFIAKFILSMKLCTKNKKIKKINGKLTL